MDAKSGDLSTNHRLFRLEFRLPEALRAVPGDRNIFSMFLYHRVKDPAALRLSMGAYLGTALDCSRSLKRKIEKTKIGQNEQPEVPPDVWKIISERKYISMKASGVQNRSTTPDLGWHLA